MKSRALMLRRDAMKIVTNVAMAGVLFLAGCSSNETMAPVAEDDARWLAPTSRNDASLGIAGVLGRSYQARQGLTIQPAVGGKLEAGRYSMTVPPYALNTVAVYTMEFTEPGIVEVQLGPHGAVFNEGRSVRLDIDLHGTDVGPDDDITLYWLDESTGQWVDVGGVWTPQTMTLKAELDHFSTYRPGRAGW